MNRGSDCDDWNGWVDIPVPECPSPVQFCLQRIETASRSLGGIYNLRGAADMLFQTLLVHHQSQDSTLVVSICIVCAKFFYLLLESSFAFLSSKPTTHDSNKEDRFKVVRKQSSNRPAVSRGIHSPPSGGASQKVPDQGTSRVGGRNHSEKPLFVRACICILYASYMHYICIICCTYKTCICQLLGESAAPTYVYIYLFIYLCFYLFSICICLYYIRTF